MIIIQVFISDNSLGRRATMEACMYIEGSSRNLLGIDLLLVPMQIILPIALNRCQLLSFVLSVCNSISQQRYGISRSLNPMLPAAFDHVRDSFSLRTVAETAIEKCRGS
jgi:hypothetical protein